MKRSLSLFDILCLGVNAIIGSGIFLIPGRLATGLGPASVLLFALCGVMLITVALCFAEAASRVDRNGGPYNYVRAAFGDKMGFAVGWIAFVTAVLSFATVTSGLPSYLAIFIPGLDQGLTRHIFTACMIGFLTWINIRGVKLGALATNIFTVGKIIPLLLLAVAGLFVVDYTPPTTFLPNGIEPVFGLILAVVFTYQGFEVAPVPAGETINAKTVVPRAMILSLLIASVLYMWLQFIVVGSGANLAGSEAPLADAAGALFGAKGAWLISLGGVISMTGYVAAMVFSAPRYLTVLCEDGFLPAAGAKLHPRHQTPYVATLFLSGMTYVFTLLLDFSHLVDISAIAVVLQYIFTCAAIPFLRRKFPDEAETYRIPGGVIIPTLGILVCLVFIIQISWNQFLWSLATILLGLVVAAGYGVTKSGRATKAL